MKITETISVNPGKNTLGQSESVASNILRASVINKEAKSKNFDFCSLLWPSAGSGIEEFKKYNLPLRALFATILIVGGLSILQNTVIAQSQALGILDIIFGGCLAIGLFTRPIMAAASAYYAISAALAIRAGQPDISTLSMMFGTLLFCALGSGKYSVDMLIRHSIYNHKKNRKFKKTAEALSYKAFHYAK